MAAPKACYLFDGDGDSVTGADNAAWDIASAASFGLWFRRDYDDLNTVSYLIHGQNRFSLYIDATNHLCWTISGATGTLRSNARIGSEHLYFVVVTGVEVGTALHMAIYINGALDNHQILAASAWPAATTTALFVGSDHTPANLFKGTISSILGTSDQLNTVEIQQIYDSATGQITDLATILSHTVIIDVDTEGDLANAGTGTNPFTATNAVARTYMDLWQSHSLHDGCIRVPEAETGYNTRKKVTVRGIRWWGDTIADGDLLLIENWDGSDNFQTYALADDTGGYWVFEDRDFDGLKVTTLAHGLISIEVA